MSRVFLYSASAISTQNSFEGGPLRDLIPIESNKILFEPEYKNFIKPIMIRRMSKATKMSMACAAKCLADAKIDRPDAIIVGTGLGALADTKKFLHVSTTQEEKALPPTAFIQSGHNTIAGQIALLLGIDCYNMTHVQQGVSFEHSLMDATLSVSEGKKAVLTGAVDEHIEFLDRLAAQFNIPNQISKQLSEGAGYFIFGPEKARAMVELVGVSISRPINIVDNISTFLEGHNLGIEQIDKGFIGYNLTDNRLGDLPIDTLCYTDFGGRHFTSSAFGTYLATEYLQQNGEANNYAMVINIASELEVGLTLLKSV